MAGLEGLDKYMERGYDELRWVRVSSLGGDLQVALRNKRGDLVCLRYDISTDSLTGGQVYRNKGLDKKFIEEAEIGNIGISALTDSETIPWAKMIGILKEKKTKTKKR